MLRRKGANVSLSNYTGTHSYLNLTSLLSMPVKVKTSPSAAEQNEPSRTSQFDRIGPIQTPPSHRLPRRKALAHLGRRRPRASSLHRRCTDQHVALVAPRC
jgi:hypothetical protein